MLVYIPVTMRYSLPIVTVLVVGVFVFTEASKCDKDKIHKIEHSWKEKTGDAPRNILEQMKAAGKTANVQMSSDIGSDEFKCSFTSLQQPEKKHGMNLNYVNVLKSGGQKTGTIYIEEHFGHLENQWADGGGKAYRYLVYHSAKPAVWAYYKCEDEGAAGEPQGLIKVAVADAAAATQQIQEAAAELQKYDIKLTRKLETDCPTS